MEKNLIKAILPEMLSGTELDRRLEILPPYDPSVRNAPDTERLIALQSIYDVFVPTQMAREIYSKLYLSLLHSLHKKQTITAVKQSNINSRIIHQKSYESIICGQDAFTVVGLSGIGKSSAISRAIRLLMPKPFIMAGNTKIIPALTVQSPADASIKGMLFEILRKADEYLETAYFLNAQRTRASTDILIGTVSQIALNHIGLLVVDEIQNIVNSKNGRSVIGVLTQLINNSGISVVMVGVPECTIFFQQAMMLARRSVGLQYAQMAYGDEFKYFCKSLLKYIYTREICCSEESLIRWLYQHSQGNASVVVSLLHDAQEIAILSGKDTLDIAALNEAFSTRLEMLHEYISPDVKRLPAKKMKKMPAGRSPSEDFQTTDVADVLFKAKAERTDAVAALKAALILVEEVYAG